MNLSGKIYSKTGKGAQALSSKSRALSSDSKKILASIDGKTDAATLMEQFDKLPDEAFITMINQLEADGYIRFVKNKDWEFDDDDVGASNAMVVDELSPEDFFAFTSQAAPESKSPPTVEESAAPKSNEVKVSPRPAIKSRTDRKADGAKAEQIQHDAETRAKAEEKARQETERKAHEEADQLDREAELTRKEAEAEVAAKANAEKLAAERLIREEEARQKAEAEARAKAETEARLEAERLAREEGARKQAEARAKVEHEAKLEAERKAREDAERKARLEEDARQKAEAKSRAKAEKDARIEAERIAKLEAKHKAEEEKAVRQKAKDEARALAAELAREQAEKKVREDAERKVRKEEEARQKAEAEARAKAEKEARLEAERIAKLEAKRKAEEEKALRQKAKDEARTLAAELARDQSAQKAREKAQRKAEKEALKSLRPPLNLSKWLAIAKKVVIYSPLIALLLLGLLHAVNLRMLADPVETRLSEIVGEPVSIREVRISLFPAAELTLSGIGIGEGEDSDIGLIRMSPMVLMQSDDVINIQTLEIEGVTVSGANASSQMRRLAAVTDKNKLSVAEVLIKDITMKIPGLELAPFSARIIVPASGGLDLITLESDDKRLEVSLVPANEGYKAAISANAWQLPGSRLQFTELKAEGFADNEQIHFDQIVGKIYGGILTANLTINWADRSEASGSFELNELSLPVALSSMKTAASIDGSLNIKGSFSGAADVIGDLVDNLAINAAFVAVNGKINGVNLSSQMVSGSDHHANTTRFDKLTGSVEFKDDRYQYRKLLLVGGQFKAKGIIDIQADQDITGKVLGELNTPSRVIKSNLNLSGKVGNVKVN